MLDFPDGEVYGYKTGDLGYLDQGMLYYGGRADFQIKLNGYRIETEDIENNLRKLAAVRNAAVLPAVREGKVTHLNAFVILKDEGADRSLKTAVEIKKQLRAYLPEYMIPKKIIFKDSFPTTPNGKTDRKKLGAEL